MYPLYTPSGNNTPSKGSPSTSHKSFTSNSSNTNDLLYTTKAIHTIVPTTGTSLATTANSSVANLTPSSNGISTTFFTPITSRLSTRHSRKLSHVRFNKKVLSQQQQQQQQDDYFTSSSTLMIPFDDLLSSTATVAAVSTKKDINNRAPVIPTDSTLISAFPSSASSSFSFKDVGKSLSPLPNTQPAAAQHNEHTASIHSNIIEIVDNHNESSHNSSSSKSSHNSHYSRHQKLASNNCKKRKKWYRHWLFSSKYWGPFTSKFNDDGSKDNSQKKKKGHWPMFTYLMVSFSLIIFSGEILLSKQTTGEFFELEPFNYMLGPSIEIMIQVGARFPPCMRPVESMPADERYVCLHTFAIKDIAVDDDDIIPNKKASNSLLSAENKAILGDNNDTLTTSSPGQSLLLLDPVVDLADPRLLNSSCSLSTICGMTSFHEDNIPDQTYRLVSPLFIHTGLIHLIINMAFLLLLGRQVERVVNCLRFSILFFGSGIFGHALGANFAPPTTPFLGCSSSLFGFIGFLYIDLVANWKRLEQPLRYLIQLLLGTAFSFIIGLLPGVDNFSHLGGLTSGILLSYSLMPPCFQFTTNHIYNNGQTAEGGNSIYTGTESNNGVTTLKTSNGSNNSIEKADPLDEALDLLSKSTDTHNSNSDESINTSRQNLSFPRRLIVYFTQLLSLCLYGLLLGILIHHFETSKIDEVT